MTLPTHSEIQALHRKYAPNEAVYDLVFTHCTIVNEIAQWAAHNIDDAVDGDLLRAACLLHDIGTYLLFDENGKVPNQRLYPLHAITGAKIVLDEGLDPCLSKLIETHILMGLTKAEIDDPNTKWILPSRDYLPDSIEAELLCYGDRFHSKHPTFNSYETFLNGLERDLPLQAAKLKQAAERFGVPDVAALAKKYGQPIR